MNHILYELTPEERLLLSLCCLESEEERRTESVKRKEVVRGLVEAVRDWEEFVRISNEHGVIALCWYNLKELGFEPDIPGWAFNMLHSAYLKSLTRNTLLHELSGEVLYLAKIENIKIVLLKGLALEKSVYGSTGLRQMNDIDILVRKDQALMLRNILLKNGFSSMPMISPLHERILPAYGKHLPELIKKGIAVEIHFRLFEQKGISLTEKTICRAVRQEDGGNDIWCPDPQMAFLYLVKHLDLHERGGTSQLRLYTDLVVLLTLYHNEILNESLFEYAQEAGIGHALEEKLYILGKWWGLGTGPYSAFSENTVASGNADGRFLSFLRNPNENKPDTEPESLLTPMKEFDRISDKLLFLTGYVFPSLEFMKYRYKAASWLRAVFYYPVRWWRLVSLVVRGKL